MKQLSKILKKKKKKINRFPLRRIRKKGAAKELGLITILKKGLKKKKRKTRLAGRNYYVLAFKKLLAFHRQFSFFMLRYATFKKFKYKANKNFYIFVPRRKYKNTIIKRAFFKKIIRLGFFNRLLQNGRKQTIKYVIKRKPVKAYLLFILIRKLLLSFRAVIINRVSVYAFRNKKYFSDFYFSFICKTFI